MSNRDSLGFGDLLPQDVVQIFAQEKHGKRGRKKRSHSLGRALGWLKGKKRKNLGAKGQNLGLGPALDLALDGHPAGHQGGHKGGQKSGRQAHPHGNSHAVPKHDNDNDKTPAPPLLQENVFIEASRPKYLEDLHTEALEGLKMMQQEETNNGVEYQDNESTISTMTIQTDGEGGGFMTDSTIPDTSSVVSVQSSVSTRSSRSGLTRQGSTFRPLNSGKKSEKGKRRRHRKTVVGIPHHVQRELGLDRVGWTVTQKLEEEQLYNGETDDSSITDGPQQAAESQQYKKRDQVEQLSATHAGHRDDLALLQRLGPDLSNEQRPRSLAVPWMTTANSLQQEPPSPVMTMSPQAAYMSKIIPNAVLPPSIEVVEISRGRSRNSLRTVSKSSLLLSSPAPSRASSRASTITSASRHKPPILSDSSCWSNSESSETLVSDSSTISSSSTPRQKRSQDGDISAKEDRVSVHSSISKSSRCTSNGKVIGKGDMVKKDGQFVRSLSVMKPKKAPPPPSRSYSLHNKMKRRSRDLAEVRVISGESSIHSISASGEENEKNKAQSSPVSSRIIDSPGYNADTSSLDDSTGSVSFSPMKSEIEEKSSRDASQEKKVPLQENKLGKIISPSSGYSSQDATSPQISKQPHSASPRHKRGILAKLQRLFPGSTSAGSALPPLTQPEVPENTKSTGDPKPNPVDTVSASPSVRTLRELFNIPPPPKVHAPPPPPPEVWAHSKRTFELLLGPPAPENVYAIIKKNPKDRRQQRQSPSASTDGSMKSLVTDRKHKNPPVAVESINGSLQVLEGKKLQDSVILNAEIHKENDERLAQNVDLNGNSKVTEKDEKVRVSDILSGMLVKAVEKRDERLAAVREEEVKKKSTQATEVKTNTDTLPAMSLVHISPSPSNPVSHHHPQLLTKQTTEVPSVTSVQVISPESSWPLPPPPMAQVSVSGPDEMDYPLPPPPFLAEAGLVMPVQVPPEKSIPGDDSSCTTISVAPVVKTECIKVTTEAESQKSSSSQGIKPPPLNIPPPPAYTAPPPPVKAISPHTIKKVCPPPTEVFPPPPAEFSPPPPEEFSPPPPKEFSPPPPKEFSPPPPEEFSPLPPKEFSPPPPKEFSPPPPQVSPLPPFEVSSVRLKQSFPPLVDEVPPTIVKGVSPMKDIPTPSTEEVHLLSSPEDASEPCVEAALVSKLSPPQSIPPPPQPQLSEQDVDLPQENVQLESETKAISLNSILTPPQSIPPPPLIELPQQAQIVPLNTNGPATHEVSTSPSSEVSPPETSPSPEKAQEPVPSPPINIPLPPPLPVQDLTSIKQQLSPSSTENQSQEPTPAHVVQEEPLPIITPSLLQMVKLRSVNSSPEPPKAQEQPQAEVTMRKQQSSNQVPASSASGEAPQKPIRRSLIMTSPTPTPPPVMVTSQPAIPKSQSPVAPFTSLSTVPSPTKKSPPAMIASPSMNLQEAIRLRTAARSKESPVSRLSLHSPTSPVDLHKSPSSTASFIFSKSNKKVVIETMSMPEAKGSGQINLEASCVTKVMNEESAKKGVKVPPPVAKKPKSKAKENESSGETEQTAGQEAQQDSIPDATEKTNGTAGTVEGEETPSI